MWLAVWLSAAQAGSLDLLEVGGMWGTPASTGPAAVWWNPGALGFGQGTHFLIDVQPTFGRIGIDRAEPEYDWTAPSACEDDPSASYCTRPVYGGRDELRTLAAIPFVGLSSDLNVPGLGVGLAFFVPHAAAGQEVDQPGSGRTHLRFANVQATYLSAGVGYAWKELFGFGAAVSWVHSSWSALIDNQTATSFRDYPLFGPLLANELDGASIEDPDLLVLTDFGPLLDDQVSFQAGLYAKPHPEVAISVGYSDGAEVVHQGRVGMDFGCPDPKEYPLLGGPAGAPSFGVCDATMEGKSSVGYRYPMRVNAGIAWLPGEGHSLELMGGWVRWSEYHDFDITVTEVESLNTEIDAETAALLEQHRQWARGSRDSFWVGVDGKVRVHDQVVIGGRATFDRSAVPEGFLSPNNVDFDAIRLGALVAVRPAKKIPLAIGLSYLADIKVPRTVDESVFGVDVDPQQRQEDRTMYPEMNGRFTGSLHRLGISLRGDFDTRPAPQGKGRRGGQP